MMKATKTKQKSVIDVLCDQLVEIQSRVNTHEEKHAAVFDRRKELQDEKDGVEIRLKEEVRKLSEPNGTKVIIDNSKIHVSVAGKSRKYYDWAKASEAWPQDIVKMATIRTIDAKIVESLISAGKVDSETASTAMVVEPMTPAVSIRLT